MQQKSPRRWARPPKTARYTGYSEATLEKRRAAGLDPPFYKIGRAVFYDLDEIDDWLASGKRQSTWEESAVVQSVGESALAAGIAN